jgi:hypothetical protein
MNAAEPPQGANNSPFGGRGQSVAASSAPADLRGESRQQQSASCDDSHLPSIPAAGGAVAGCSRHGRKRRGSGPVAMHQYMSGR